MHGHHVLELGEPDASDERTNILVLCTGCHEGVHLRRRYIGQLYDRRSEEDAA
jgi:predicted HNH restriction endonuclease